MGSKEQAPPEHVGIVFVHGVGYQDAGETLVAWLHPIVRMLREGVPALSSDPVYSASIDHASSTESYVDVVIPAEQGHKAQRWTFTEAWWASSIRPPGVGAVLSWLTREGGVTRMAALVRGRVPTSPAPSANPVVSPTELLVATVAAGMLVLYSLLRPLFLILPFERLRSVVLGPLDRVLTAWAGDMRVLLSDETQAAVVRDRLAAAVRGLSRRGCKHVVVIAHSGGAVVSYMTLTDPAHATLPVTKLITFGQGLGIAWRLLGVDHEHGQLAAHEAAGRFLDAISAPERRIRWYDYWASHDPVPLGPVVRPPTGRSEPLPPTSDTPVLDFPSPDGGREPVGTEVSNRASLQLDHGTYFENDEEFVIRLVRHLDTPTRSPARSRFFNDQAVRRTNGVLRAQRMSALAMIRKAASGVAMLAVVSSFTASFGAFYLQLREDVLEPAANIVRPSADFARAIPWIADLVHVVRDMWWPIGVLGFAALAWALALLVWNLKPRWAQWIGTWGHSAGGSAIVAALSVFLWALIVWSYLFVIPSLIGTAINVFLPDDVWLKPSVFAPLSRWVQSIGFDQNPLKAWVFNVIVTGTLVVLMVVITTIGRLLVRSTQAAPWHFIVGYPALALMVLTPLGLIYAVVKTSFGYHIVGWLVLFLAFSLVGSLGSWRWNAWDSDERHEARRRLAGAATARPLGRAADSLVLLAVFVGAAVCAVGIALFALLPNVGEPLLVVGILAVLLGVASGVLQDLANDSRRSRATDADLDPDPALDG